MANVSLQNYFRGYEKLAGMTGTAATEAEEFNKDLTGDIGGGIGAEIGNRNGRPTVIRTLADTPAQRAGRC